jgi:hypothetical protein
MICPRSIVLTAAIVLVAPQLPAREKNDVVVMENGDRLTGEIKGLDSGVLYVGLDYVDGTVSVQWSKVVRLESNQLFLVKAEDGSVYTGALSMADGTAIRSARLQVMDASGKKEELNAFNVVRMSESSERFWQRFSGETSLGTTFTKGNDSTQLYFSSQTEYLTERWLALARYNSSLSASSGDKPSTWNQLNLESRRLLPWNNYFCAGLAGFLQSTPESIKLQTMVGAGFGRYLRNTNRARISLLGGLALENTQYNRVIASPGNQNLTAALIAADVRLFRFSKTNLSVTSIFRPAISAGDRGRVRFNTNVSYYIKLIDNLSWNISFYGDWDTRPPAAISGSDYGSTTGLTWTYGIK